jgi:hypothetical protein
MHGLLVWASGTVAIVVAVAAMGAFAALTAHNPDAAKIDVDVQRLRHTTMVIFAFSAAATSFVSGVAAWWAATKGGEHRDDPAAHKNHYVTFRKR